MGEVAKNPITGDTIQTKTVSDNYRSNYDAIFRKPEEKKDEPSKKEDEK